MRRAKCRIGLAAPFVLWVSFASAPALADMTKAQCIDANGKAQDLRRDGKLSAAREQLRLCVSASCPAMVRADCVQRLDDLEKVQPSMIFDVEDAGGGDVIDVRVAEDGQLLAQHLDGTPLMVDPGAHMFTFEVAGRPPVSSRLLVREGEAGRHERIVIPGPASAGAPSPAAASPTASPLSPPEGPSSSTSSSAGLGTQRVVGLVLGGAGIAGVAAGVITGLLAGSAWSEARTACGGSTSACTDVPSGQSRREAAVSDATISTVAFIAGGALLASGIAVFVTGGRAQDSATGVVVSPSVGPQGAALTLRGAFQ